jgi:hypothetical protein
VENSASFRSGWMWRVRLDLAGVSGMAGNLSDQLIL